MKNVEKGLGFERHSTREGDGKGVKKEREGTERK